MSDANTTASTDEVNNTNEIKEGDGQVEVVNEDDPEYWNNLLGDRGTGGGAGAPKTPVHKGSFKEIREIRSKSIEVAAAALKSDGWEESVANGSGGGGERRGPRRRTSPADSLPPQLTAPVSGDEVAATNSDGTPVVEEMSTGEWGTDGQNNNGDTGSNTTPSESETSSFEDDSFAAALAQYQSRGMKKHNILPERTGGGGGEMGSGKVLTWDESRKVYLDQRRIKTQWRPAERLWEIEDVDEATAGEVEEKVWKENEKKLPYLPESLPGSYESVARRSLASLVGNPLYEDGRGLRGRVNDTQPMDEAEYARWLAICEIGAQMLKYGRYGFRPHLKLVRVNVHTGLVDWGSGSFNLRDAQTIQGGKNTKVLEGVGPKVHPGTCFSVVMNNRTLDLQAANEDERDLWLAGLRELKRRLDLNQTDDVDWAAMSTAGANLIKHGKHGKPKTKIVRVDHRTGLVDWGTGSLNLRDSTDVVGGKNTKVLEKVPLKVADPKHCFSVVLPSRTLDLQCETEAMRDMWLEGLKELREHLVHPKNDEDAIESEAMTEEDPEMLEMMDPVARARYLEFRKERFDKDKDKAAQPTEGSDTESDDDDEDLEEDEVYNLRGQQPPEPSSPQNNTPPRSPTSETTNLAAILAGEKSDKPIVSRSLSAPSDHPGFTSGRPQLEKKGSSSSVITGMGQLIDTSAMAAEAALTGIGRVEDFLKICDRGTALIKHQAFGFPHSKIIKVNAETGVVDWGSGALNLRDAIDIKAGKHTKVFQTLKNIQAGVCLSIILPTRTLDLQCKSTSERNLWYSGLREVKSRLDASNKLSETAALAAAASAAASDTEVKVVIETDFAKACKGTSFIKHGRLGRPKVKTLKLDVVTGLLDWGSGAVNIKDSVDIVAGKNTKVFEPVKLKMAHPKVCFSVIFRDRTLDLQANTEIERNLWVTGLKEVAKKLKDNELIRRDTMSESKRAVEPVFTGTETVEDLKKMISDQDVKIAAIELELQSATDRNTALEQQAKTLRLALDPTQSGNVPWSRSRRRIESPTNAGGGSSDAATGNAATETHSSSSSSSSHTS